MSGAHDVARDAAARLLRAAQQENQVEGYLSDWSEDIETVARYLGVETDRPRVVRHSNSQIAGQHVCDVNCREEVR